jgi:hypothetical protein
MNGLNDKITIVMKKMFPFIDAINFDVNDKETHIFISIPKFVELHPNITPDPFFRNQRNQDFSFLSSLIKREGDYKDDELYLDDVDKFIVNKLLRITNMLYVDEKKYIRVMHHFNSY